MLLLIDGYRFRYPEVYGEFPLVCWVSFSIPTRTERYSCVVDIVPLVPGIVFDTYVGGGLYCEEKEGVLLLIDGYRFRYP